ncbi:MAG TPA: histidine kinase, partial [Cyanothece sp. UBA12306]|nr:histidine kinase [Cyanothece sp. UBA12306]
KPQHQIWSEASDLQESQGDLRKLRLARVQAKNKQKKVVAGINLVSKNNHLVILGQPGAGKTTFLKHLALQCSRGDYRPDLIPCFLELRSWLMEGRHETTNLLNYFLEQAKSSGLSREQALQLLERGKGLFLVDGLDEISQEEQEILAKDLNHFAQLYHKNKIIITCRSDEQLFHFQGFTYVEMSTLSREQIQAFARLWFGANTKNKKEGESKASKFIEELEKSENEPLLELGISPILLNLMCSVFLERLSFPRKRAKLYQTGLDILLKRWDQARGIERDGFYQNWSSRDKIKLLCQIAAKNFEDQIYFFEADDVLAIIEDYLTNNLKVETDLESLWLTSKAILKSLQLQHGLLVENAKDVYSFSHLTFQEYFTARKIVTGPTKTLENELTKLACHIFEPRWREVILLSASMLPNADFLVRKMKSTIDNLVKEDSDLEKFLTFLDQKVKSLQLNYQEAAVKAFYFNLFSYRDLNLAMALDRDFVTMTNLSKELKLDSILARCLIDSINLAKHPDFNKFINLSFSLFIEDKFKLDSDFQEAFQQLKSQLPLLDDDQEKILNWWQNEGNLWVDEFCNTLIKYRHLGYNWRLSAQQNNRWQIYYNANLFLVECLREDFQISSQVKQEIQETILCSGKKLNCSSSKSFADSSFQINRVNIKEKIP